jgi:hypothetical protein
LTKKGLIKFTVHSVFLLLIVWLIDLAAGSVLRHFYFSQTKGDDARAVYTIEKANADLMIFGSSRGARNYHPEVMEQRFGLSYYNAAREGCFMFYHEAVLRSVLQRHVPKQVFLDFRYGEFRKDKENYERLSALLPFYKKHPEVRPIVEMRGPYEKAKLLSAIYPFNSALFKIVTGNVPFYKEPRKITKGYIYYDNVWKKPKEEASHFNDAYNIDSSIVVSYRNFIQLCKEKNIQLAVVVSPYYRIINDSDNSVELAKKIAAENNVAFFDYSHEGTFVNNRELISDPIHLNDNGARLMSNMLAGSLLKK